MKDDIRIRLMEAIKRDADRHTKLEDDQRRTEEAKEQFEAQWEACIQTIILPAMQPVKEILEPLDWSLTSTRDSKTSLTISIGEPHAFSLHGSSRPHLQFSCDSGARCIRLYAGKSSGIGEPNRLEAITAEFVQEQLARFVEALTTG
jgi:hypothetical protein